MPAIVIQIDAYDPVAGAAVVLRAASVDDERVCHLNGQTWLPAVASLPSLRYDLFDGGFAGRITTPQTSFSLAIEAWPNFARYMLADARVQIWTGEAGNAWAAYTARFDGRIQAQPAVANGVAAVGITVDDKWLDTPLLATYAGTTGIEGDAPLKGRPKPLALGAPRYAPGLMIDVVNNVMQLSSYGAIQGVEYAMEKLARFGASIGDYATYAALVAAAIPAGQWGTCKASGLVRHGAPPVGPLSYHLQGDKAGPDGWVRLPGSIIRRIANIGGGAGKYNDASLTALDAARPWNLSLVQESQTTARDLIQRIAASVNAVAGVDWLGKLFVIPIGISASALTLDASGAALPPVAEVGQMEIEAPYWKLAIGAKPTWLVHALSEVAFTALLVQRGRYDNAESYREGHVVDLADGSTWLYINAAASSGHAPPAYSGPGTANAYWSNLSPPTSVGDLSGVGDLATLDTVAFGNGTIQTSGGATATDPAYQTALGTAAAISGQGPLATAATADFATQVSGATKPEDNATVGDNLVPNSTFFTNSAGWSIGTATRQAQAAGDPASFIRVNGVAEYPGVTNALKIPAGMRKIYVSYIVRRSHMGDQTQAYCNFFTAAGTYLSQAGSNSYGAGYDLAGQPTLGAANQWVQVLETFDVPDGATQFGCGFYLGAPAGHMIDLTMARAAGTQTGADQTRLDPRVSTSDRNASAGDNLIKNAGFQTINGILEFWTVGAGAAIVDGAVAGDSRRFLRSTGADYAVGSTIQRVNGFDMWPMEFGGLRRLYISARVRASVSNGGHVLNISYFQDNNSGYCGGHSIFLSPGVADTWKTVGQWVDIPDRASYWALYLQPFARGGTADISELRVAGTERDATLGADVNSNIIDSGNPGGTITLPRNEVRTSLGTAAAITGQGTLATANSATWSSQITGRPAELTDGRITAGLDASGDLVRNITTIRRDSSNLLGRSGGGAFTGELAADVTGTHTASAISGQGALATLNSAAWGSQITGRPAELTDGRITAGLDAAGDIVRNITTVRRDASNLLGRTGGGAFTGELAADVTGTHTASAISGQGALATLNSAAWSTQVTGTGKPQDYATQTGVGTNEVQDDWFGQAWTKANAASQIVPAASGGYALGQMPFAVELTPSTTVVSSAIGAKIPVIAGRRYYFSARVSRGTTLGAGSRLNLGGRWVQADGVTTQAAGAEAPQQSAATLTAGALPLTIEWSDVAPTGAAYWEPKFYTPALATSSGTVRVEAPRVSTSGLSATITGPASKTVNYDYTTTALSGQLPTDLNYSFTLNGVSQAAGVTWSYLVLTGTLNGFTVDDGSKAMTGAGGGTLTITSVGTNAVTVRITATSSGQTATSVVSISRNIGAAPAGGGSGSVASGSVSGSTATSSYADKTGSITGTMPSGKTTANITADLSNTIDSINATQTETVSWKLERNISGTWTQIGATITSQAKERIIDAETGQWGVTPGAVAMNINDTGLTAGASYSWRISAARTGGSHTNYISGPVTVTAP